MEQQHKSTSSIILLICNAVLGALFFGYSISYMNPAINTADKQFGIAESDQKLINGTINALPAIGAAIGAISTGSLLGLMSLRDAMVLADVIGILGFSLQLPLKIWTLLLGRFVIGVSIGLNSSLVPQYIKEFSPRSLSGPLGGMFQLMINIGSLIGLSLGFFFENDGSSLDYMRFVFDLPMLICAFRILFLAYIYTDAPPSYYLSQGENDQAKRIISLYYKREFVDDIFENLKYEQEIKNAQKLSYGDLFANPLIKKRVFIGSMLQFFQQFCGINAIMIYSSGIFDEVTAHNDRSKNLLNIGVGLDNLFFSLVCTLIINKFGRRPLLLWGSFACAVSLVFITILTWTIGDDYENNSTKAYFTIVFIYSFLAAFQLSLGPIAWIYCADILPEKGMSIAVLTNWISCALVAQFFLLIKSIGGLSLDFLIFSIFCSFGFVFIFLFIKETKDKSAETIENMFSMVGKTAINN